jgi:hypothetical protein
VVAKQENKAMGGGLFIENAKPRSSNVAPVAKKALKICPSCHKNWLVVGVVKMAVFSPNILDENEIASASVSPIPPLNVSVPENDENENLTSTGTGAADTGFDNERAETSAPKRIDIFFM